MTEWKEEYSVGVPGLDDQHKELFKLLDDLSDAIGSGKEVDVDYALTKLHVYALFHFSSEEHLLAKYGYDKLEDHSAEHSRFRDKVQEFRSRFANDKTRLATEVRDYIDEWIAGHILKTDKQYQEFLSARVKFKDK